MKIYLKLVKLGLFIGMGALSLYVYAQEEYYYYPRSDNDYYCVYSPNYPQQQNCYSFGEDNTRPYGTPEVIINSQENVVSPYRSPDYDYNYRYPNYYNHPDYNYPNYNYPNYNNYNYPNYHLPYYYYPTQRWTNVPYQR